MNFKPTAVFMSALVVAGAACAQDKPVARSMPVPARAGNAPRPCEATRVDPPTYLTLGKSQVIHLDFQAARLVVGGTGASNAGRPVDAGAPPPGGEKAGRQAVGASTYGVADTEIALLSPTELFFLGRRTGSMNVVLQTADGRCIVKDIVVTIDPSALQTTLSQLVPDEPQVKVVAAENSVVLTGVVSDAVKLDHVLNIASSYTDKKVVNLLRVATPQQVMLEVKIAEVSKNLLDKLGLNFSRLVTSSNGGASSVISGIIGGGAAVLGRFNPNVLGGGITGSAVGAVGNGQTAAAGNLSTISRGATLVNIDAQKKDGLVRILAEPNIMAISGQSASFLSGGRIFIPIAQSNSTGGSTITLEEKEFGVGLKFTPTVLDGTRINLKLLSEVSDLSQTGSPFTTVNNTTAILPSMTTRRVDTTVQLQDGQSFAVAGLIRSNTSQALDKFPGLGDVPVLGALFRSTEFQTDQSELLFVITPRLVKPMAGPVAVPTDNHIVPSASDVWLSGQLEGKDPRPAPAPAPAPAAPAPAPAALAPAPAPATEPASAPAR